ncbi:MAG: glycosyltransferase family 39 protein [Anaerolineales bacterium]|nr:glycosyltransferase family 39 protein [Anaerolineales bacterium]
MKRDLSSPKFRWALLLLVMGTAVLFRFYQLDNWPPGLYRDEAFNGLDALNVLDGQHALFFPANNGREPAYIYLTAGAIVLFGRSATAVRLAAALVGSLTALATYLLAKEWFGQRVGLLSAALWAITLWPVHLSRVGLRPILLAPLLALTFWLGTRAYRSQFPRRRWLWLAAGILYGAAYYTYLAVRFTPLLLILLAIYDLRAKRHTAALAIDARRTPFTAYWSLLTDYFFFALGTAVTLSPFALLVWRQPDILLGRTGQVSVLNTAVNGGNLFGTLLRQTGAALGMFIGHGDTILRHNPAGRPVFDWFMAVPFLIGLGWCLWHWRRRTAVTLLLWVGVMLGPTILAADTPHFLRASGILPAVVIFPAIGLVQLADWLRRRWLGAALVGLLLLGSTAVTIRDYAQYSQDPDTGYLFEAAARTLAERINQDGLNTTFFVDERYWSWPSVPFLITNPNTVRFAPKDGLPTPLPLPAHLFVWPYADTEFVADALPPSALVEVADGPLARGDLEAEAYPLYTSYRVLPAQPLPTLAVFGETLRLQDAGAFLYDGAMQVDLIWRAETAVAQPLTAFVHLVGPDGLIAQDDAPPGSGNWPTTWWQPGLQLHEQRTIPLPDGFDPTEAYLLVGLYDASQIRLPVIDGNGRAAGDSWRVDIDQ